jgi:hypothetical protein
VNANVRGGVVKLEGLGATITPMTGQVEVVRALAADAVLAHVIL